MEPDFSGYATKAGIKCSDGRTITAEAFKHMDGQQVPLVWQHGHNKPELVLGHAVLEAVGDGVRAHGFFNDTPAGQNSKLLVQHKDINQLSIFANQLVEKGKQVLHGMICEVSLVLKGANKGALIDFIKIAHGDGDYEIVEDEAIITMGLSFSHSDGGEDEDEDEDGNGVFSHATVKEIYDDMSQEQKDVLNYMVEAALLSRGEAEHDGLDESNEQETDEGDLGHKEGSNVTHNVFEKQSGAGEKTPTLTHGDMQAALRPVIEGKATFKEAMQELSLKHGITNISVLFPDARNLGDRPEFLSRRMEWVSGVLAATKHSPFSRVKTLWADITQDEARAKGYITGHYKKEEWFAVTKRTTGPTTIYKKQKLDRDDIIDITDFDVVAWMREEMKVMLEEELARAILVGDGRDVGDEDHIADPMAQTSGNGVRSILNEHELFAATVNVNLDDANSSWMEFMDEVLRARTLYKGSGNPSFYTTNEVVTNMLLLRDEANSNRRLYNTVADVAAALRVKEIVEVEVMESYAGLIGIMVNLGDYNIGADKGGELTNFDDFDIDYNQYKYLIETRLSGALTKPRSALIFKKTASTNVLVRPITQPTFVASTGVVTIPTQTGVVYKNADTNATLTAGAQTALTAGSTLNVKAVPASGYYFANNVTDEWPYKRPAA